jgi:hypothetical protein
VMIDQCAASGAHALVLCRSMTSTTRRRRPSAARRFSRR